MLNSETLPPGADPQSLTPAQRLLFHLEAVRPRGAVPPSFALFAAYRLTGPLDRAALDQAFSALVSEHDCLRPPWLPPPAPQRLVVEEAPAEIAEGTTAADLLQALVERERVRALPVTEAPLARAVLGRIAERDHLLCLSVHCCAADASTLQLLVEELAQGYTERTGPTARHRPPRPRRLREADRSGQAAPDPRAVAYWRERLAGAALPPRRALSFARIGEETGAPGGSLGPRPTTPTGEAQLPRPGLLPDTAESVSLLDPEPSRVLRALGAAQHATPFVVGLAGFAGWLAERTGVSDLLIPTITLARRTQEEETAEGTFLNLLPLRVRPDGAPSFEHLIAQLRDQVLDALDRELPLYDLLEPVPALARTLADPDALLLPFQTVPDEVPPASFRFGGCAARLLERAVSGRAGYSLPFDALVTMRWTGSRYALVLEHRRQSLDDSAARRLLDDLRDWMAALPPT